MSNSRPDPEQKKRTAGLKGRLAIWGLFGLLVILGFIAFRVWIAQQASEAPAATGVQSARGLAGGDGSAIGRADYDDLLSRKAGIEMSGMELARRAEKRCIELDQELETLAEELGESSWREAFEKLSRDHPPTREDVLETYRQEIERARLAVLELDLVTLPERGVTVTEIHNPAFQQYFSLAMYLDGRLAVTLGSSDVGQDAGPDKADAPSTETSESGGDDESYLRNHCRICIPPLAVHEIYPGHHIAFERLAEILDDPSARRVIHRREGIYHEGWGLYAEQLMLEQGYYDFSDQVDSAKGRLGALRMLYLRALRAWIDPLLHSGDLDTAEAERWYQEKALMTPKAARSEVQRHLKDPVMKASYFVGLEQILQLRTMWRSEHPEAPLKVFHDQFLGRPRAIPEVARTSFGMELERPARASRVADDEIGGNAALGETD